MKEARKIIKDGFKRFRLFFTIFLVFLFWENKK
jgi:hypothetical protein